MILPFMSGWQASFWPTLQARVGFAVRPLPAGSKRLEIALPAATSGRTSPAGAVAGVSRGASHRRDAGETRHRLRHDAWLQLEQVDGRSRVLVGW